MPQYHFRVHKQFDFMPMKQATLPDDQAAKEHAENMASHLGDIDPTGYVVVTDASGVTVARVPARKTQAAL